MSLLDRLAECHRKALKEGFEIVRIDLRPEVHDKLKEELEKTMRKSIRKISSIYGIPVKIEEFIPQDKLWIIKRKRKSFVE